MGLIHLVELIPKPSDVLLRNGRSTVKYGDAHALHLRDHSDLDPLLMIHMMERIGQVIAEYLLCLIFIRPYIDRLSRDKVHGCLRLLDQDLAARKHSPDQPDHIETLHLQLFRTKFQLIQSQ